jgi:hypothetical protein
MNDVHQNGQAPPPLPWERQPGESPQAWRAFVFYRDLGPGRTLPRVGEALYPARGVRKPSSAANGRLRFWCASRNWVARCAAWDARIDQELREADLKAIAAMRGRHTKEAVEIQEIALTQLRAKATKDLSARAAISVYLKAVDIERIARGVRNPEQTGKEEGSHYDPNITVNVLGDRSALDAVNRIFNRVASIPALPMESGGVGVARDEREVEAGPSPEPDNGKATGHSGGALP